MKIKLRLISFSVLWCCTLSVLAKYWKSHWDKAVFRTDTSSESLSIKSPSTSNCVILAVHWGAEERISKWQLTAELSTTTCYQTSNIPGLISLHALGRMSATFRNPVKAVDNSITTDFSEGKMHCPAWECCNRNAKVKQYTSEVIMEEIWHSNSHNYLIFISTQLL